MRAAWRDLRDDKRLEGASTITQQLARTLWLGTERGWRRKIPETLITMQLEQKLTKQQIFEYYANSIYLGNQGSFSIHGFGEGSQVYLGKDLSQDHPDRCGAAGRPDPESRRRAIRSRHPDRALGRRNMVLKLMRENDFITEPNIRKRWRLRSQVNHGEVESSDAPYFVDLVNDELQSRFQDRDFYNSSNRVYTTLDLELQHDAVEAVRAGIAETDPQWKRQQQEVRHQRISRGAGGAGGALGGNRRASGDCGRAQLRHQPVESCHGHAAARIVVQTVRIYGGHDERARSGQSDSFDAGLDRSGRSNHLLVRTRHALLYAQQLWRQVRRSHDAALRSGAFQECSGGESGRDGGIRQSRRRGAHRGTEPEYPADSVHRFGRLRSDAA